MLKQRVYTALVLLVLVLSALFVQNPLFWQLLVCSAVLVGYWEWLRFCAIQSAVVKGICMVLFVVLMLCVLKQLIPASVLVVATCFVWLLLMLFTTTNHFEFLHNKVLKIIIGMWILAAAAYIVVELKTLMNGVLWVLCFIAAVAIADIGAYFVGKRFGKTKLAPVVSPGKTIEGLLGGLVMVSIVFVPILFSVFEPQQAILVLLTILTTALVSVVGDLFESKMKRYVDLKDSGHILPGHGGVLDRVDGFLASAPFFAFGLMAQGLFSANIF